MQPIEKYTINENSSIFECMLKFEENNVRTLFIVNNNHSVIGSITDGDIRKGLLKKRGLHTPAKIVMNLDFIFAKNSDEALQFFNKHHYLLAIPILDSNMKMIDVVLNQS